ncbi:MAG: threonylcarbamoyl-AMP synthase [Halobacteriovoraceae bacterium]|jgi:tRNA threonylcarbamoyl adenosine modification protein (Sua5/YciO/YrdC/YwlC family)|nr:threonylcarbamoyl-AMP synthase [Halobacteriovoraceae bacterium]
MIEYIIAHSPDDRVLVKASKLLSAGKIICFPTDTSWTLAACSTQKNGIEKLYKIKKEGHQKHFSILCNEISRASELAHIENHAFKLLKKTIPGNYTFIFEARKKIAKLVQASKTDKEVGIRFVPSTLVDRLIEVHGEPLISTNIIPSLVGLDDDSIDPIYSYQLEDCISHLTELIIDPGEFEFVGQSSIIDFSKGDVPQVMREGVGDVSLFI